MFKKAYTVSGKRQVIYEREDGSKTIYVGGDPAWRNNNPGNLENTPFSRSHGSLNVTKDRKREKFAIFPNYEVGRKALLELLKTKKFQVLTIWQAVEPYAPKEDKNNPEAYRRLLKRFTGFDLSRKVSSLDERELETLMNAIERVEGAKPGKIIEVPAPHGSKSKISAVRKNKKGTITQYYVEDFGWLKKTEAIELATQGKIDAVVATSRSGNLYLRTRPDLAEENLEDMG